MPDACIVLVVYVLVTTGYYPMQTFEQFQRMQLKDSREGKKLICIYAEDVHGQNREMLRLKRKQCKLNKILLSSQNIHTQFMSS